MGPLESEAAVVQAFLAGAAAGRAAVDTCYTYLDAVAVASSFPVVDSYLVAFDMASVPVAVGDSDTSSAVVACTADSEELRLVLAVALCLDAVAGIDLVVGSFRTWASGHCNSSCLVDQLVGFDPVAVEAAFGLVELVAACD